MMRMAFPEDEGRLWDEVLHKGRTGRDGGIGALDLETMTQMDWRGKHLTVNSRIGTENTEFRLGLDHPANGRK